MDISNVIGVFYSLVICGFGIVRHIKCNSKKIRCYCYYYIIIGFSTYSLGSRYFTPSRNSFRYYCTKMGNKGKAITMFVGITMSLVHYLMLYRYPNHRFFSFKKIISFSERRLPTDT